MMDVGDIRKSMIGGSATILPTSRSNGRNSKIMQKMQGRVIRTRSKNRSNVSKKETKQTKQTKRKQSKQTNRSGQNNRRGTTVFRLLVGLLLGVSVSSMLATGVLAAKKQGQDGRGVVGG